MECMQASVTSLAGVTGGIAGIAKWLSVVIVVVFSWIYICRMILRKWIRKHLPSFLKFVNFP